MSNGRRRALPCLFCQDRTHVVHTCTAQRAGALRIERIALCPRHLAVLISGGDRGRVHAPTGVRWWLGSRYATAPEPSPSQPAPSP